MLIGTRCAFPISCHVPHSPNPISVQNVPTPLMSSRTLDVDFIASFCLRFTAGRNDSGCIFLCISTLTRCEVKHSRQLLPGSFSTLQCRPKPPAGLLLSEGMPLLVLRWEMSPPFLPVTFSTARGSVSQCKTPLGKGRGLCLSSLEPTVQTVLQRGDKNS